MRFGIRPIYSSKMEPYMLCKIKPIGCGRMGHTGGVDFGR